ncbi:acetoin:2,6-dichlorophenolindophenol oxidoreductase subunit beta [Clostridium pasteurianum DSM 525 = ATCC 6013]|uniref:Acetoin:2,6-dichlorophenolindophenol oxidoreductase subunit beta n=1 Tax=Clostridium pasteurianum DSM 525 = ATCC 6013 TaxID=1262449 RepID=A0A0H3J292_CLOPA|nr:alpha-ketoacid dehydrogenase subunit beta [Clostridium pasteurianum]AJA48036.1 acetoin:2,6-dichlorophenolindophenol oxidoreductase subunit beta [Clostridium pasteurianum DSM 525 = ATCC 6013]AJA52024.1 acetoin:2,6-dichlorophenolindophenol oxidoreductase subunit beta [Clostridium pasteurianum DSM 525 = ATCC 6013]AOZ75318.1 acetoin dehydrogenase [Clostridium pasteurianum DSM 525 = ATCC 6013]AOZ79113.1 acetoin dehydrogenase [Clostridium pasteurianum]ELP59938.1 TPP-dependent acetoin dehydrogenas
MKTMSYSEAIREGMRIKMLEDENVFIFGEDVGPFGGCFGVTSGMHKEFGEMRVRDTPISEGAILGCAIGAAATGLRPIAELMFMDFSTVAMDMIVNQAAKLRYMTGGKMNLPLVVRMPCGAGVGASAQHSQSLEAWFTHIPGLKVVYPSTPADAAGLIITAIEDDNPVIFMEHKMLYAMKGEVPEEIKAIPFGVADIKREGKDITIIATGRMVHESLKAAKQLEKNGIDAEVIDPRTLFPLDKETIFDSIKKTNRVLIVTEENKRGAYSGEISAEINEKIFDYLDAPVIRVASLNTPIPYSPGLESFVLPTAKKITEAAKSLIG